MKKIFFITILSLTIFTCADWETMTGITETGVLNTERTILVEDFTGASCPNCPVGATELENILDKYPNNVVVLGIHSTFLAGPAKPGDPSLITKDANDIEKFMGNYLGKPEAAINRRLHTAPGTNIRIGKPDTWITYIDQELRRETEARLSIDKTFDSNTRELKITLNVTALIDLDFPIQMHCAISESGIITAQKNPTGVTDEYDQKHVLRKLLTPVGGDLLADKLSKDQTISKEYSFILPAETNYLWKSKNCSIVGFISRNESEKIILQAAERKVE